MYVEGRKKKSRTKGKNHAEKTNETGWLLLCSSSRGEERSNSVFSAGARVTARLVGRAAPSLVLKKKKLELRQ